MSPVLVVYMQIRKMTEGFGNENCAPLSLGCRNGWVGGAAADMIAPLLKARPGARATDGPAGWPPDQGKHDGAINY